MNMGVLSVRIGKELEEKLDFLMKKQQVVDKSAYVRQLLNKSIANELLDYVCTEIKQGKMSAWKGAETVNISLRVMLKELAERNIMTYDEIALNEDLEFIKRV
jgi:predicted HTH domain antitoxin